MSDTKKTSKPESDSKETSPQTNYLPEPLGTRVTFGKTDKAKETESIKYIRDKEEFCHADKKAN